LPGLRRPARRPAAGSGVAARPPRLPGGPWLAAAAPAARLCWPAPRVARPHGRRRAPGPRRRGLERRPDRATRGGDRGGGTTLDEDQAVLLRRLVTRTTFRNPDARQRRGQQQSEDGQLPSRTRGRCHMTRCWKAAWIRLTPAIERTREPTRARPSKTDAATPRSQVSDRISIEFLSEVRQTWESALCPAAQRHFHLARQQNRRPCD